MVNVQVNELNNNPMNQEMAFSGFIPDAMYEIYGIEDYAMSNGAFSIKKGETKQCSGLLCDLVIKNSYGAVISKEVINKKNAQEQQVERMVNAALEKKAKEIAERKIVTAPSSSEDVDTSFVENMTKKDLLSSFPESGINEDMKKDEMVKVVTEFIKNK